MHDAQNTSQPQYVDYYAVNVVTEFASVFSDSFVMEHQTNAPKLLQYVHSQVSFYFVSYFVSFISVWQIVMMCYRLGLKQLWVL